MKSPRSVISGSERIPPETRAIGRADPTERAEISIYLKRPVATAEPRSLRPPTLAQARAAMVERRTKLLTPAMDTVIAFAEAHRLEIVESDPARRLLKVAGSVRDLEEAFGTSLGLFDHPLGAFRGRSGALTAPSDVADLVEAVLGLDQRPVASPKCVRLASAAVATGSLPSEIAETYDFPKTPGQGKGECVAIIELGGGVAASDTIAAFKAMSLPAPEVVSILVDGAIANPGDDPGADGEVALDVQVAGACAPRATLAVYFAPNTDQGFVDAISQAAHDQVNAPSVMSISWGAAESQWTQQAVAAMNSAFEDAADLGLSVFAASGDGLATDGQPDGKAHVDFPASSPWVVGCGGTRLAGGAELSETVWNDQGAGTGGGISDLFPVPVYQTPLTLPPSANGAHQGRGVPDVAGDADPATGYRIIVSGKRAVFGGTSAVAPLWAGLFALINEGAGKPAGQPHAVLYSHPTAFNDVRGGDNRDGEIGYRSSRGWDACTGLGTPKGSAVAALFRHQPAQ